MAAGAVIHEAAHKQVEAAVTIEIEPDRAGAPVVFEDPGAQPRLLADIRERPVSVVVIENRPAIRGLEDIGETVVVVIAYGNSHAKRTAAHSGLGVAVGDRAVAIVLVERVANRLGRLI